MKGSLISDVMEKYLAIKTFDNASIYGTLNYRQPSDRLIIFVHGLAGHRNEHQFFNAVPYFTERGFSTFRFNLYGWRRIQRKMIDCTIRIHGRDITKVIGYFSKKYSKIYLVGHSLGGPSISSADNSLAKAIVLWDPATHFRGRDASVFRYVPALKNYLIHWNTDMVMGKKMMDEWKSLHYEQSEKALKVPTKIICAGKGLLHKYWKEHWRHLKVPTEFTVIKNSNHTFDEEGAEEKLFKETFDWLVKWK